MTKAGTVAAVEIVESFGHFPQLIALTRLADIVNGVLLRLRHEGASHGHDGTGEEDAPVPAVANVEIKGGVDATRDVGRV